MKVIVRTVVWLLFIAFILSVNEATTPLAAQQPGYNAAFLTDEELENYTAMSEADIRQFLISHNSYFSKPVEDVDGVMFDPAAVIATASHRYNINPQVILVTLQKESVGVTRQDRPSDITMRFLMGCIANSTAREQLACSAERFRAYHDDLSARGTTVSGWRVGAVKETQDGVGVTPATKAVAGQFTYTPYAGAQWGGNDSRWGGVYLFCKFWNEFGFGDQGCDGRSGVPEPPPSPIPQPGNTCVVGLDPGHGGTDAGAIRAGVREADIVWDVSLRLRELLEAQGYQVALSRSQNVDPSFVDRVAAMRHGGAHFIVSVHANASCYPGPAPDCYQDTTAVHGVEAWYQGARINPQAAESRRLAELLTNSVADHIGLHNRGVKEGAALYTSDMPSALIELAFMNNPIERDMMVNQPEIFARAIAEAVFAYGSSVCGPPQAPPMPPGAPSSSSSTILVFDTSGSMRGAKLNGAKQAGHNIIDVIAAENEAFQDAQNQIALVEFNTRANAIADLSSNLEAARADLQRLRAEGWTAMADGLRAAVDILDADVSQRTPIIILLSDGIPNVALGAGGPSAPDALIRQQIVDIAVEAGEKGYCIYTVGFGSPGELDETLLQQIPQEAGCGEYFHTQESDQLTNIYVTLRHTSVGEIYLQETGVIAQGEQVAVGVADIPANQSLLLYTLNWPGSRLDPILTDPRGRVVTVDYPGASLSQQASIATVIVDNPLSGSWSVAADGVDVPGDTTTFQAVVSSRVHLGETVSALIWPLWLMLGGLALFTAVIWGQSQRGTGWYLAITPAGYPPKQVKVGRKGVWIGRSRRCHVQLQDPEISQRHCWIGPSRSRGTLFVYDNRTTNGTMRNDQPVEHAGLTEDDLVKIGDVEIRPFRRS